MAKALRLGMGNGAEGTGGRPRRGCESVVALGATRLDL